MFFWLKQSFENKVGRKSLHKSTNPHVQGAAALVYLVYVLVFLSFLKALCRKINTENYGIFRLLINRVLNEIIFFTDYLFDRLNGSRFSHNNT